MNAYQYHVSGYIIKGDIIIQMGCFTRSLADWQKDFWNNNDEFPEGSPQGALRLAAFNRVIKIMEMEVAK
jgi:hypothetical protein